MDTIRQEKINKLIQFELSEIFRGDFRVLSRGGMITVTRVRVTPDLTLAKIYLSVFATPDKAVMLKEIRKRTKEIRGKLGNKVKSQLRIIPELNFYIDDSLDYIDNIESLLHD